MPFFSVIIPLFNKEKYIEDCINSVLQQTYQDFELIIVDDCSTDHSLVIVKKIVTDKIKIVNHNINKGLATTRNTGIRNANGKYITFLDADDLYTSTFLEKISSLVKKFPESKIIGTNYWKFDAQKKYTPDNLTTISENYAGYINFFENSYKESLVIPSSLVINSDLNDELKYFDENLDFFEDVDFFIKNIIKNKLIYTSEKLSMYRINIPGKMSNENLSNKRIIDFEKYKNITPDLDKYIDFQKYYYCKAIKPFDKEKFRNVYRTIHLNSLTWKQKIILILPNWTLSLMTRFNNYLKSKGINWNSY